jgi:hypothetical protein
LERAVIEVVSSSVDRSAELIVVVEKGGPGAAPKNSEMSDFARSSARRNGEKASVEVSIRLGDKSVPGLALADAVARFLGPRGQQGQEMRLDAVRSWTSAAICNKLAQSFDRETRLVLVDALGSRDWLWSVLAGRRRVEEALEQLGQVRKGLPPGVVPGVVEHSMALLEELGKLSS